MKKGFTLVEMLAVILILGIIFLIGVPIYQGVRKSTNESIYESKISNVKSKAEKYSSESGTFIYDIRYMIKEGLLTPDNESGEYLDPRTGRDMQCDLVRIELVDESFYANVEETTSCYDIEDLQNMSSVVKIVFYKTSDGDEAYPNGWIRANTVYAGYTVPEGVTVTKATWGGGWNEVNGRLEITASEILNVPVNLYTEFTYNGQPYSQNVSRKVMLDIQSPYGKPTTTPRTEPTPNLEYIEWRLSDGDGSGVAGHVLLNETQYATKKCSEYTPEEIPGDDKTIVGEYLDNGTYYMCVKDNVGNITNDSDAEDNRIQITSVDYDPGIIKTLNIESRTPPYQLMDVKIITELKDTNTTGYEMCISHTGYLENCTWEKYEASKDYTIHGYDYGASVLFYISIKDRAGNISNRQKTYIIDKLQRLDLNGNLNGTNQSNIANLGTCDVYINDKVAKTKVTDYWVEHVPGTKYVIKNCTSNSGYKYKGNKEVSGTIGRSGASSVYLPYVSLYTIKYNMNGGSGSVGNQTKEHGTAIKLATTTSKKTGYAYGGWNTKTDGTGTNYNAGANYTGNGNVTLYAKWNINSYVVTWNANGGSCNKTSQSVNYGSQIGTLPTCTKSNYTFQGWYTAASGGTKISTTTTVTKAVTYYAQWKLSEPTYKEVGSMDIDAGVGLGNNVGIVFKAYKDSGIDENCKYRPVEINSHVMATVIKVDENGNLVKGNEIKITSGTTGMGFGELYAVRLSDTRVVLVGNSAIAYTSSRKHEYITGASVAIVEVNTSNLTAKVVGGPIIFGLEQCQTRAYEVMGLACAGNNCRVPVSSEQSLSDRRPYNNHQYDITINGNSISASYNGEGGDVTGDSLNRAGRYINQAPHDDYAVLFTLNNGYVMSNTVGYSHMSEDITYYGVRTLHIPLSYYPGGYYAYIRSNEVRWRSPTPSSENARQHEINNQLKEYIQNHHIQYYPIEDFKEYVDTNYGCCVFQRNNFKDIYDYGCDSPPPLAPIGKSSFLAIIHERDATTKKYVYRYKFYTYPEDCKNGDTSAACTTPAVKVKTWDIKRGYKPILIPLGSCVAELSDISRMICY